MRIDQSFLKYLDNLGYAFFRTEIGSVQCIVFNLQTGKHYGGADARRIGAVVGLPRPRKN